ncbi:hypothetical protein G9A89_004504 [Geosiphon pyriformis]|nr:hypothetical protein G9A89_004504 [Geosiphon pyriformis]
MVAQMLPQNLVKADQVLEDLFTAINNGLCEHEIPISFHFFIESKRMNTDILFEHLPSNAHSPREKLFLALLYLYRNRSSWNYFEDQEMAFEQFQQAAYMGNSYGQFFLGKCLSEGMGVPYDPEESNFWYLKAALQGNSAALFMLGWVYEDSVYEFNTPDKCKAFRCFQKSALGGHCEAQGRIGYCFERGWGTIKDKHAAIKWYRKSTENAESDITQDLQRIYLQ